MFRGPEHLDLFGRIIAFALSILFGWAAFSSNTQLGGRHGKEPTVPIGSAGRVIIFLMATVLFLLAVGVLK